MPVCVIKNTEPRNTSIPISLALGSASGLALRQFLPVYKPEIDTVMFDQTDAIISDSVSNAKNKYLSAIKKSIRREPDNPALKLFIKQYYTKKHADLKAVKQEIKNAPQKIQKKITSLRNEMAAKVRAARNLTDSNIKSAVKQARSVWAFLLPGAALGLLGGYIYNIIGAIKED